jgi:hypothetical protein
MGKNEKQPSLLEINFPSLLIASSQKKRQLEITWNLNLEDI